MRNVSYAPSDWNITSSNGVLTMTHRITGETFSGTAAEVNTYILDRQGPIGQISPLKGTSVSYTATPQSVAIPLVATGVSAKRVNIESTTAAYIRLANTSEISAAISAAGTGYVPAQLVTLTGGTALANMVLAVATTKAVSATVAAGGTGNIINGAGVIVEGTTGTGTKFRASVTISSNAIASVQSISTAGSYTVNPTDITQEPVTYISGSGGGTTLTGAKLNVVMGVDTVTVSNPGQYSVLPSNPVAQSGATVPSGGTGATFTVTWVTAASAGDRLVQPGDGLFDVDVNGLDYASVVRVTADGAMVITPIG